MSVSQLLVYDWIPPCNMHAVISQQLAGIIDFDIEYASIDGPF